MLSTMVGVVVAPSPAGALSDPTTTPADQSSVKPPTEIRVEYGEPLHDDSSVSNITVTNGNGSQLSGSTTFTDEVVDPAGVGPATMVWTPTGGGTLSEAGSPYHVVVHAEDLLQLEPNDYEFDFFVDGTPPLAPTITSVTDPVNIVNEGDVAVSGAVAGTDASTVAISIGDGTDTVTESGVEVTEDGTYEAVGIDVSSLADGVLDVAVIAVDAAGNESVAAAADTFKDTVAPDLEDADVDIVPEEIDASNQAAVEISGTSDEGGLTVAVSLTDGIGTTVEASATTAADGSWTVDADVSSLVDGEVTATATATDPVGNTGSAGTDTAVKELGPPILVATSPTGGATLASGPSEIVATYHERLDTGGSTITVTDNTGAALAGATAFRDDDTTIVFTPSSALGEPGSPYTVTMDVTDLADVDGAQREATDTFVFFIGSVPDYMPLTPVRLLDTRDTAPLGEGETRTVDATTVGGVPHNAEAVVVNVTAVNPTQNTYLTVYPTGDDKPLASAMNPRAGEIIGNEIIAKVGSEGTLQIYNHRGAVDVVLDVVGWVPEGSNFEPLLPARVLDTRDTTALGAGETRTVDVTGIGGVPDTGVGAVVVNVIAVKPTRNTYLTVFPTGAERPLASSLNPRAGEIIGNEIIASVGDDGTVQLYNNRGDTEVVFDVVGWIPDGADYQPLTPARVLDTRETSSLGAEETRAIDVTGIGGVPHSGVGAVVVNVTAVTPTAHTHLTVFPTGSERPLASSMNPREGDIIGNEIIAKVGSDGTVQIYNHRGAVDVVFDVVGWLSRSG